VSGAVDRRARSLARSFQAIALSLGIPGLWIACSQAGASSADAGEPDAASPAPDATLPLDAAPSPLDSASSDEEAAVAATTDATAPADVDATQPVACWATVTAIEGGPDAEERCTYILPCGLASATVAFAAVGCQVLPATSDGSVDEAAVPSFPVCYLDPGHGCEDGSYVPPDGGVIMFECVGCASAGGRRPAGLRRGSPRGRTRAGAYLAELAALEEASVRAFELLASELESHGAPRHLVLEARASAGDERRHARAIGGLAARFGGVPARVRYARPAPRSLAALARENAVEGCVRETFGALVNAWQAARAVDSDVRARMAEIARDELRHAALSWEVQAWAEAALSPRERRGVARAKRSAVAQIVASAARAPGEDVREVLGLPDATDALALARGLIDGVWADA
jgi:hypothetical protein